MRTINCIPSADTAEETGTGTDTGTAADANINTAANTDADMETWTLAQSQSETVNTTCGPFGAVALERGGSGRMRRRCLLYAT